MKVDKLFTLDQLESLIKVCGECGVSELDLDKLHVKFSSKSSQQIQTISQAFQQSDADTTEKDELRAFEQEEFSVKTDQLAEMALTDPVEFERLQALGDLTDEAGHSEAQQDL
jgi:hypothetical protein